MNPSWRMQIHILCFGQTILIAMIAMSLPYWPLYIAKLGPYSAQEIRFWSAAIYLAPFVSSIVVSPLWGKMGDKYGYKSMVVRAGLGLFITQMLILCVSSVEMIFVFRLLQGVLAGFTVTAQAFSLKITPQNEKSTTLGKIQSASAMGNLLGPLMGGVIATFAGYKAIFSGASVICAIISLLFIFFLKETPKNILPEEKPSIKKVNFKFAFSQHVLPILLIIILIQLARSMITPIFALFVTEKLGGNDLTVGILYAATGLMIFVTAPCWGKFFDKINQSAYRLFNVLILLLCASSGLQALLAFVTSSAEVFILRLLWGICLGALLPILLKLLVDPVAETEKGYYLGYGNSATKLGNLIGILTGAIIEAFFGFKNSFFMISGFYLIAGIVLLFYLKPNFRVIRV